MKFWIEQMGVKFIDEETGKELDLDDCENDSSR